MKTAISIPDGLFEAAERLAKTLGLSRSRLYQEALSAYLSERGDTAVTDELNAIYSRPENSRPDPVLEQLQKASLDRKPW